MAILVMCYNNASSKLISNMMCEYELVMIVNPEIADEQVSRTLEKVTKFVSERGGTVTEVNQWGKKKLAYPIKRFYEGNYILSRFSLEANLTKALEASLRLSEDIIRYLLVKLGE